MIGTQRENADPLCLSYVGILVQLIGGFANLVITVPPWTKDLIGVILFAEFASVTAIGLCFMLMYHCAFLMHWANILPDNYSGELRTARRLSLAWNLFGTCGCSLRLKVFELPRLHEYVVVANTLAMGLLIGKLISTHNPDSLTDILISVVLSLYGSLVPTFVFGVL